MSLTIRTKPYDGPNIRGLVGEDFPFDSSYLRNDSLGKLRNWILNRENVHIVARDASSFVGYVFIRQITSSIWGMWNAYVPFEHRGRGISKKLYNACMREVHRRGGILAIAQASPKNPSGFNSMKKYFTYLEPTIGYVSLKTQDFVESRAEREPPTINYSNALRNTLLQHIRTLLGEEWYEKLGYVEGFRFNFIEPEPSGLASLVQRRRVYGKEQDTEICGFTLVTRSRVTGSVLIDYYPGFESANAHELLFQTLHMYSRNRKGCMHFRTFGVENLAPIEKRLGIEVHPHKVCYRLAEKGIFESSPTRRPDS